MVDAYDYKRAPDVLKEPADSGFSFRNTQLLIEYNSRQLSQTLPAMQHMLYAT